jgi:hypothetical protein
MQAELRRLLDSSKSSLAEVRNDFSGAGRRYEDLRRDLESRVVRWEWSSSLPRYELDPLHFLDETSRRGKATKKPPATTAHKYEYGHDVHGQVLVARLHTEFPGKFYESFVLYEPRRITSFLFDYQSEKRPINLSRLDLDPSGPLSFLRRALFGEESHAYKSAAGRVHEFVSIYSSDGRDPFGSHGRLEFESDRVRVLRANQLGQLDAEFEGPASLYGTMLQVRMSG